MTCSGHGVCEVDDSRDATRTTLASIASAEARDQPGAGAAAGDEQNTGPTAEEEAAHKAKEDALRDPFYAGVCKCDRGYIGDDCGALGEAEPVDIQLTDGSALFATAVLGGIATLNVFMVIFVIAVMHEPLMNYCSTQYCFLIEISVFINLGGLPLWLGAPNFLWCALRPCVVLLSLNLFTGTIFARVYRTTFLLWGKSPPNVVVTDPGYMVSILRKQSVPLIVLLVIFTLASFVHGANRQARMPGERIYQGYGYCEYGPTGNRVLAAAIFYVAMISCWCMVLLYYLKKRVAYTQREPFYHGERMDMTRAMAWVVGSAAVGYIGGLIFARPTAAMPNNLVLRFLVVAGAMGTGCAGGLWFVMMPKYRTIYVDSDRNIVFQGERFAVPVTEGGRMKKVRTPKTHLVFFVHQVTLTCFPPPSPNTHTHNHQCCRFIGGANDRLKRY